MGAMRVGVVGAGAIGGAIARAVRDGQVEAELVGLHDTDAARLAKLCAEVGAPALPLASLAAASDILIESAAVAAVEGVVRAAVDAGCDVMVMSIGGMLDRDDLVALARAAGRRIYLPTGAIAGLDGLRAMAVAGVERVTLTTTKPPAGLAGAPHLRELDLGTLTEPTVVFEGSAAEAMRGFPKNVNVAAALSLAGLGAEGTTVRVVADPRGEVNRHEIEVIGAAGRLAVTAENVPSPDNPRTSYLAALSAVALLRRLTATLVVGT